MGWVLVHLKALTMHIADTLYAACLPWRTLRQQAIWHAKVATLRLLLAFPAAVACQWAYLHCVHQLQHSWHSTASVCLGSKLVSYKYILCLNISFVVGANHGWLSRMKALTTTLHSMKTMSCGECTCQTEC